MAWLPALLAALGVILGAGLGALVGGLFVRRRNNSEAGKLDSEAGKLGAEAAQIIANAAAGLVAPLGERVGVLERQVAALETENAATAASLANSIREGEHTRSLLDSAVGFIRTLMTWIERHVPGVLAPEIPPELRDEVRSDG
ncbi:hypothetical protein [Rhodococcus sp. UNC363MFTsu5.1]|uniref:hypothetical protein n=1 Tax=Rhodococcus sp. UNC363MFTsu5.1 TaxID=1449069 RepID=UPI000483329F|nr:hypothetical protein [Rhodococcus sp. UNC363MFTsu5.1]